MALLKAFQQLLYSFMFNRTEMQCCISIFVLLIFMDVFLQALCAVMDRPVKNPQESGLKE